MIFPISHIWKWKLLRLQIILKLNWSILRSILLPILSCLITLPIHWKSAPRKFCQGLPDGFSGLIRSPRIVSLQWRISVVKVFSIVWRRRCSRNRIGSTRRLGHDKGGTNSNLLVSRNSSQFIWQNITCLSWQTPMMGEKKWKGDGFLAKQKACLNFISRSVGRPARPTSHEIILKARQKLSSLNTFVFNMWRQAGRQTDPIFNLPSFFD